MYSALADILEQIDETTLIQLTDDTDAGAVDSDAVDRAIADADSEIDSYCGARYSVPFSTVPPIVRKLSVDIAVYNLYARRQGAPDDRKDRYNNAVKLLVNIAKGLVTLGENDPDSTPSEGNAVDIDYEDRIFTRTKMSDF